MRELNQHIINKPVTLHPALTISLASLFIALSAQISIPVPFSPVPILQGY